MDGLAQRPRSEGDCRAMRKDGMARGPRRGQGSVRCAGTFWDEDLPQDTACDAQGPGDSSALSNDTICDAQGPGGSKAVP